MSFKETEVGMIPEDWNLYELSEKTEITMGQSPKSKFYNNEGEGIPFMQGRKTFGDKYHEIDTWCTDPKRFAKKGDVLMSVRAPVGDVNIARMDLCIGRGLSSLRMRDGNNEYLYYLLRNYIDKITSRETGTVFGSINKSGLETLKLPFSSGEEQRKIANILSTLDEKIEINNQINKNLEKMAQAIFKHWFVDFEFPNEEGKPYQSSGGEMVESELGLIPKGWEVKALEEVCNEITRGITPKYVEESNLLMLNQKVNKGDLLEKQYYKFFDPEKDIPDNKRVRKYDILINSLGQGTLGRVHYYLENTENVLVDQHISIVRPIEEIISSSYAYQALKSREYQHRIESSITGSTGMLMLNISKVRGLKILVPDRETNRLFAGKMESIYKNKLAQTLQNEVLMDIRDTLLPKLMSGEIRVPLESESDAS